MEVYAGDFEKGLFWRVVSWMLRANTGGQAWGTVGMSLGGGEKVSKRTCHFRHEGLKLGRPLGASSSAMKTYSVGVSPREGLRRGSSLAG